MNFVPFVILVDAAGCDRADAADLAQGRVQQRGRQPARTGRCFRCEGRPADIGGSESLTSSTSGARSSR